MIFPVSLKVWLENKAAKKCSNVSQVVREILECKRVEEEKNDNK
jgi:hypothetical protein